MWYLIAFLSFEGTQEPIEASCEKDTSQPSSSGLGDGREFSPTLAMLTLLTQKPYVKWHPSRRLLDHLG